MDKRGERSQNRLALCLFFSWLLFIWGGYLLVGVLPFSPVIEILLMVNVVGWGFVWMHMAHARYQKYVALSPILRGHWCLLRRMFKVKRLQAHMLRKPARGVGEIGDFKLDLRVLANGGAIEIHADVIPGPPISIPWSEVEYIRIHRPDDAQEMRAHLRLRQLPRMPIYIPWDVEFDRYVPAGAS